jgi:hypothetical protein
MNFRIKDIKQVVLHAQGGSGAGLKQWVGLTDEEIWGSGSRLSLSERGIREFARAIEAKLKEKNHGRGEQ